ATPSPAQQRPGTWAARRGRCPSSVSQTSTRWEEIPMTTHSWIRRLFPRTPRTVRKAPPRFRPRIAAFEDRITLSTFKVGRLGDGGGDGTLRQAINLANANPGPDTIKVYENHVITGPDNNIITLTSSLPAITGDLTIESQRYVNLTISGADKFRVLQ